LTVPLGIQSGRLLRTITLPSRGAILAMWPAAP
jgi:hypothetical protein